MLCQENPEAAVTSNGSTALQFHAVGVHDNDP